MSKPKYIIQLSIIQGGLLSHNL